MGTGLPAGQRPEEGGAPHPPAAPGAGWPVCPPGPPPDRLREARGSDAVRPVQRWLEEGAGCPSPGRAPGAWTRPQATAPRRPGVWTPRSLSPQPLQGGLAQARGPHLGSARRARPGPHPGPWIGPTCGSGGFLPRDPGPPPLPPAGRSARLCRASRPPAWLSQGPQDAPGTKLLPRGPPVPGGGTHRTGRCFVTPGTGGPRQPSRPSAGKCTKEGAELRGRRRQQEGQVPSRGARPGDDPRAPSPAQGRTSCVCRDESAWPRASTALEWHRGMSVGPRPPATSAQPPGLLTRQRSPERAAVSPPGWGRVRGSGDAPEPRKTPAEAAAVGRGAARAGGRRPAPQPHTQPGGCLARVGP